MLKKILLLLSLANKECKWRNKSIWTQAHHKEYKWVNRQMQMEVQLYSHKQRWNSHSPSLFRMILMRILINKSLNPISIKIMMHQKVIHMLHLRLKIKKLIFLQIRMSWGFQGQIWTRHNLLILGNLTHIKE